MNVNRTRTVYVDNTKINVSNEERVDELNVKGVELSEKGYYAEALRYFSEAHKLAPRDLTIKNNLLICKRALRKIEEYKKQEKEYKKLQEKEKLQRIRDIASKKSNKHVNLGKFPNETEKSITSDLNWCNNCCTYIPNDKDFCPYCGSMDIE